MSPRHPRTQNRHIPECFEYTEVKARDIIIQYGLHDTGNSQEHAHDDYQILILPEPTGEAELLWQTVAGGQCCRQICGPHICIVGKHVMHTVHWQRKAALVALRVSENFVMRNGGPEAMAGVTIAPEHEYTFLNIDILYINERLAKFCRDAKAHPSDCIHGLGLAQASQIIQARRHRSRGKLAATLSPGQMERVNKYIEANFQNPISVAMLARAAGVGADRFARLFKQTGSTPYQYLLNYKIRKAQRLIADGGMRKCDVAAATGFSDQGHLKKSIRRLCVKSKKPVLS